MSKIFGSTCPSCGNGVPPLKVFMTMRSNRNAERVETGIPCPHCGTGVRIAGSKTAQIVRLLALAVLGGLVAWAASSMLVALPEFSYLNSVGATKLTMSGFLIVVLCFEAVLMLSFFRVMGLEAVPSKA